MLNNEMNVIHTRNSTKTLIYVTFYAACNVHLNRIIWTHTQTQVFHTIYESFQNCHCVYFFIIHHLILHFRKPLISCQIVILIKGYTLCMLYLSGETFMHRKCYVAAIF